MTPNRKPDSFAWGTALTWADTPTYKAQTITVKPDQVYTVPAGKEKTLYITTGMGLIYRNGKEHKYTSDSIFSVRADQEYKIASKSITVIIAVSE